MNALAIVPARSGSKGCPGKNLRTLGGKTLIQRAIDCAKYVTDQIVVTTDCKFAPLDLPSFVLQRPAELAQDDTPMIDVIKHALNEVSGPPDQPIVLLQPTQPLREPKHVMAALALLTPDVNSIVSVTAVPLSHHWENQWWIAGDRLRDYDFTTFPPRACRQALEQTYRRDGTVYAFWRRTVQEFGNIYGDGNKIVPLIIPPEETCELDTEEDWEDLNRRFYARFVQRAIERRARESWVRDVSGHSHPAHD